MTLIRTQTQNGGLPCITNSSPLVINAAHVVFYEPSSQLYWATESKYQEDRDKTNGLNLSVEHYEHARECTRIVFVTGKSIVVQQTFESFDRTFTSMTLGR